MPRAVHKVTYTTRNARKHAGYTQNDDFDALRAGWARGEVFRKWFYIFWKSEIFEGTMGEI